MGFRSVFITKDQGYELPAWFLEKWGDWWNFHVRNDGKKFLPISSKFEQKMYGGTEFSDKGLSDELHGDLQRVLCEQKDDYGFPLVLVWLHECGGITRVEIHKDRILFSEPSDWEEAQGCTHSYCGGCSDHPQIIRERTTCHCGSLTHQSGVCVKCGKEQNLVVAK